MNYTSKPGTASAEKAGLQGCEVTLGKTGCLSGECRQSSRMSPERMRATKRVPYSCNPHRPADCLILSPSKNMATAVNVTCLLTLFLLAAAYRLHLIPSSARSWHCTLAACCLPPTAASICITLFLTMHLVCLPLPFILLTIMCCDGAPTMTLILLPLTIIEATIWVATGASAAGTTQVTGSDLGQAAVW